MKDITQILSTLRRPRILVRAARHNLTHYRRERDLNANLRQKKTQQARLSGLLAQEAELEDARTSGQSTYSIQAHIGTLTALIAEARGLITADPNA